MLTVAGLPLAGVDVSLCAGPACRWTVTAADGSYGFTDLEPGMYVLDARPPLPEALAVARFPVEVQLPGRTLQTVVPPYDRAIALPLVPAELELGDDLLVTLGVDELEPPLFVDPASHAAGVRLDRGWWPTPDGVAGVQVLSMWYVDPLGHTATQGGLPVRIDVTDWGLADDDVLDVWFVSFASQAWEHGGQVTVAGDVAAGSARVQEIGTVMVTR